MTTKKSHGPSEQDRPATSADVAKRAGVSRATVSYILNDKPGVSFTDETREAVLRAAEELQYRPNVAARSLAAGSGPIVLVMSNQPHNDMTSMAVGALSSEFASRGTLATVVQVADSVETSANAIAALNPRAALLAFPAAGELGRRLEAAGIPVVSFDVDTPGVSVGALQVGYLRQQGHSQLAFADVIDSHRFGVLPRRAEVINACSAAGLPEPLTDEVSLDGTGAADLVGHWHRAGVTAVCAYNDEVAIAVLFGIREVGLRCPEDIAVIGCDDIPAAAVSYPPLTTLSFSLGPNIAWLVDTLLHRIGLADEPEAPTIPVGSITRRASA